MTLGRIWLLGLGSGAGLMVLTWVASLVRRDASLVDRVWGLAFVVLAWTYRAVFALALLQERAP